jgi:hypothetical protein
MNIRFLTAINIAHTDAELLSYIGYLCDEIENGNLAATIDRDTDTIAALHLTETGKALLPPFLPTAAA